jgi:HAD superfamily hydrolase (TIGR01662 family)
VFVVDDRRNRTRPLALPAVRYLHLRQLTTGGGRGPAAARNVGWRASTAEWIAFLDDDVVPGGDWFERLADDLCVAPSVGAVQGRVEVPMPQHRRPTDWERDVAGLMLARFITADIAYRRDVLARVGGLDEHFAHAYREDADLALRVRTSGFEIVTGSRRVRHPVGPADRWVSVRRQRGNAADARMRAKYGRNWRAQAQAPPGRLPLHVITMLTLLLVAVGAALRAPLVALIGAVAWVALTVQFAWARLRHGAKHLDELTTVFISSACIPPIAVFHRLSGMWRERRRVRAVLFDRDGTLVVDVPYNGDPDRSEPVAGAHRALARLRAHGVRAAVVTNQSGIARGLLTHDQAARVNRRIDATLGPFDGWWYCPHDDADHCACRKPQPGMMLSAARALHVPIERCVVIGDTKADVDAAARAGCMGILVPNAATRPEEIRAAQYVAANLEAAVDVALGIAR